MDDEIRKRIKRLYAAMGKVIDEKTDKFPAKVYKDEKHHLVVQDFGGWQSTEDTENDIASAIGLIGSLHDHLVRWAGRNSTLRESIANFLFDSKEFAIVYDLWNTDKHGPPTRDKGRSNLSPRLTNVHRGLQLKTGAKDKSVAAVTLGANGLLNKHGDGRVSVIASGEVVDKNGNFLGDCSDLIEKSVKVVEAAAKKFGLVTDAE